MLDVLRRLFGWLRSALRPTPPDDEAALDDDVLDAWLDDDGIDAGGL
jgi:hypothetical protein